MSSTWDRERAIRHLKNAAQSDDPRDAADELDMAARRLRFENDYTSQRVRREIRDITEQTPLAEQQEIAHRERRRLERGW